MGPTEQVAHLPCPCPVCAISGDARILRDFRISELHHTYVAAVTKKYVEQNVRQYVRGKLTRGELRQALLGPKSGHSSWLPYEVAFNYFEDIIGKGYENVKPLVPWEGVKAATSLFGEQYGNKKVDVPKMVERYRRIYKTYEKLHGTKIVPRKG